MTDNKTPSPQSNVEPRRWLLEEHLPGGSTRWHCFEHEQQCRARAIISQHATTVTPLFAVNPSPQSNVLPPVVTGQMEIEPDVTPADLGANPEAAPAETCQRCQGNGEIVTDWDRYMRGHEDENGNEAVAECPDCGGEGIIDATPAPQTKVMGELVEYFERQIDWSRDTFGPALRTKGVIDHIRKELKEIEQNPHDLSEWVDVVILAMDGFWRHGGKASDLLPALLAKQQKNMARTWPDWRGMPEDSAIEHDRSKD